MNLKNIKYKRVLLLLISSYLGWGTGFALGSEYIDVGPVPINREADHKYKIQPRGGSPKGWSFQRDRYIQLHPNRGIEDPIVSIMQHIIR